MTVQVEGPPFPGETGGCFHLAQILIGRRPFARERKVDPPRP